jgi:hypothetical protein
LEKSAPIAEELVSNSGRLYLIFGGIAAGMGMPPLEFYKSFRILNENKIFFRDFSQSWYQDGLPGIGKNVFEVGEFIKGRIATLNPGEVFFIGNSMGGFAAILFASLVGKGTAIAFAPQTFISPVKRLKYCDRRWPRQITNTYLKTALKKHVWDLKRWLINNGKDIKVEIFVSKNDRLDYIHANQLRGLKTVNIYEYDTGGHGLVRHLRDKGKLSDILFGTTNRAPSDDVRCGKKRAPHES